MLPYPNSDEAKAIALLGYHHALPEFAGWLERSRDSLMPQLLQGAGEDLHRAQGAWQALDEVLTELMKSRESGADPASLET